MIREYKKGLWHGLPIALGYVSVSFAFGIQATALGLTPLQAVMISFFNLTSAGQLAGLQLMAIGAPLVEMALTQLTINLRYALMSLSLSQKLDSSMTLIHRLLLSFCNTDEVFAVCMQQQGPVTTPYLSGLVICVYIGWALGTILGATVTSILPEMVRSAMGIAIYGMFIAIIIPPARSIRPVLYTVLLAMAISGLFYYVPVLNRLSRGWVIILCAVGVSALMAWRFPVKQEQREEGADDA